ncbi:MAG: diguanylate phosphodiesterase domain protein [Bacilli bacterium]|nr:diguanylate phosphodiesterase domain protein [Bacilli bacterium]
MFLNSHPDSLPYLKLHTNKKIIIEVTEQKPINLKHTSQAILYLKKKGIQFALDDYGAGYSNLERFNLLKPDYLKLDKSVIRRLDISTYRFLFEEITQLCIKKNIPVIAEGIETMIDKELCLNLGIKYGQGYFIGKPEIPKEIITMNS